MVVACLALPATARGVEVTADQLAAIAGEHRMICQAGEVSTFCEFDPQDPYHDPWSASFAPPAGPVSTVDTRALQRSAGLAGDAFNMMVALQTPACGDQNGIEVLVKETGGLTGSTDIGPRTIGDCDVTGALTFADDWYTYTVSATVHPRPTPSPSPTATPSPSPTPTPRPTATASVSPSGSPTPAESASPSNATASQTASPPATASTSASGTATAIASSTPEQEVAGVRSTPSPAASIGPVPVTPVGAAVIGRSALASTLVGQTGLTLEPVALAGSLAVALLLLLFMGFTSELFNSTLESHYDEVAGWLRIGRGGRWHRLVQLWSGPLGIGLFLVLGALVYAALDPTFGLDLASLATYLGLLLGLLVVMLSFELPGLVMYRRRTGDTPGIRALPWTLPAAVVCVVLSRVASLEPGYLYGILLGLIFSRELTTADEGRQTAVGAAWTLLLALGAWVLLGWERAAGVLLPGFAGQVIETGLAVVVVGSLEALAFGLLPMRFLSGASLYAWNRLIWAVLFGLGAFAFVYLLIGPHSGYLSELPVGGLIAACAAFAAFGAMSVLFWGYFRFRRPRVTA